MEGDDGELEAVVPSRCACGEDGESCRIWRHDYRERQAGPDHRLLVVRCVTHGVYFTLYPPGWTPWGRRPVVAESPGETIFEAALEAASGTLWPRHQACEQNDGKVARSQSRHIEQAARWLGLCGAADLQDAVHEVLELELLDDHREARIQWAQASSRKERAQIVTAVLEAVPIDARFCERLLSAGTASQVFDVVYIVDRRGVLNPLPPLGRKAKNAA